MKKKNQIGKAEKNLDKTLDRTLDRSLDRNQKERFIYFWRMACSNLSDKEFLSKLKKVNKCV